MTEEHDPQTPLGMRSPGKRAVTYTMVAAFFLVISGFAFLSAFDSTARPVRTLLVMVIDPVAGLICLSQACREGWTAFRQQRNSGR